VTYYLESVPGVASLAVRRMDDGELVFTVEHELEVIRACSEAGVAVLGAEIFPGLNVSTYDVKNDPKDESWPSFVRANNVLAEEFFKGNPAMGTDECVLTATSWREFGELKNFRRNLK